MIKQLLTLSLTFSFCLGGHLSADLCDTITMNGEILYWWACPDDLFISLRVRQDADLFEVFDSTNPPLQTERFAYIKFIEKNKALILPYEGNLGFRFGVGYHCDPYRWDFALNWTHFSPTASKTAHLLPGEGFFPMGLSDGPNTATFVNYIQVNDQSFFPFEVKSVGSRWKLALNMLDLTFGYHFTNYWSIPLRAHLGIRFADVDQLFCLDIKGRSGDLIVLNFPLELTPVDFTIKSTWKGDFRGAGPRFGISIEKPIWCGVGLYFNGATSLLYGDYDSRHAKKGARSSCADPLLNSNNFSEKVDNSHSCVKSIADLNLGLFWKASFFDERQYVSLSLGWELHYFFDFGVADADFSEIYLTEENHDLSTQGITLTATYGF